MGQLVGTVAELEHRAHLRQQPQPSKTTAQSATFSRVSKEAGNADFYMKIDFFKY